MECRHPFTHYEVLEDDPSSPEQTTVTMTEVEICDSCDRIINNAEWE